MAMRDRFLTVAILLTVLYVALTVCYVWRVSSGWPGDVWSFGFSVLPVALGIALLVNVWAEVLLAQGVLFAIPSAGHGQAEVQVTAQKRGLADV